MHMEEKVAKKRYEIQLPQFYGPNDYAMHFLPSKNFSKQVKGSPKQPWMISCHIRSLHAFQCSGHVLGPWTHEWRNLPDASYPESKCQGGICSRR